MIQIRKSEERGYFDHGWLEARHSFSFGDYYDPDFMGFRSLRVINEDRIQGGEGFPLHGHRDMEIITYIISGALAHKDTLGTAATILPGEVQYMSAGKGIRHSEFNALKDQQTHLLQIWIEPSERGLEPRYDQRSFSENLQGSQPVLVVSGNKADSDAIQIQQDARIYVAQTKLARTDRFQLDFGRCGWIQLVKGQIQVKGQTLLPGDAAAIVEESELDLVLSQNAEYLFFDLA